MLATIPEESLFSKAVARGRSPYRRLEKSAQRKRDWKHGISSDGTFSPHVLHSHSFFEVDIELYLRQPSSEFCNLNQQRSIRPKTWD
jgi:hypothetical protein